MYSSSSSSITDIKPHNSVRYVDIFSILIYSQNFIWLCPLSSHFCMFVYVPRSIVTPVFRVFPVISDKFRIRTVYFDPVGDLTTLLRLLFLEPSLQSGQFIPIWMNLEFFNYWGFIWPQNKTMKNGQAVWKIYKKSSILMYVVNCSTDDLCIVIWISVFLKWQSREA